MLERFKITFLPIVGLLIVTIIVVLNGFSNETDTDMKSEQFIVEDNDDVMEVENVKEESDSNLFVDIKGAVHNPGVYDMNEGERVIDAVEEAGGFLASAEEESVNLALRLYDEMMIYIPFEGEKGSLSEDGLSNDRFNINQASIEELMDLPGIGATRAQDIVEYRKENGPFQSVDDLLQISGIGEKTLERFKDQLVAH